MTVDSQGQNAVNRLLDESAAAAVDQEVSAALEGMSDADMAATTSAAPPADDRIEVGALVKGRVANVATNDVLIDLGGKMLGIIPRGEFAESPVIGDEVEALVEGMDPHGGLMTLSKKKARAATIWRDMKAGAVFEGKVTGMNRGGLEVDIGGARMFVPASQADLNFQKDISELIGQTVRVEVTKFDRLDQSVVGSRRKVQEREAQERRGEMLAALIEGQSCRGVVRNLTEYGAFVELAPGVDGLLHVSDMSWGRVTKPSEVVTLGQEVELRILKVNRETGKISLGLKQIKANPWESVSEKYAEQQRIKGRVVGLAEFGAFVELEEGVNGLVPLSEMSWTRRVRHPKEVLSEGDVVDAIILSVDGEKHRITLGLKQVAPDPWSNIAERYPPDRKISAKVARLAEFGAFVELEPGIDGLLHISEISDQRVRAVSDKLQVGQEIEVRVIKIDPETRRISLSMKPPASEAVAAGEAAPVAKAAPKKPAKPRRGGIEIGWSGTALGSLDPSKYAR